MTSGAASWERDRTPAGGEILEAERRGSHERQLRNDAEHQLNSNGYFDGRADYLRIDDAERAPDAVAAALPLERCVDLDGDAIMFGCAAWGKILLAEPRSER